MELLVRAACADDGTQHGAVARNNNARRPVAGQREGAKGGARVTDGHSRIGLYGLSSKAQQVVTPESSGEQPFEPAVHHGGAGLPSGANAVHERYLPSTQQATRISPVFGPLTPDEDEDVSPLSINVPPAHAPQAITTNTFLQAGGQLLQARASSTPPRQEHLAPVQHGIRRENLASEQPDLNSCLVCGFAFAQMPGGTPVVRPRPGYCDHTYCRGCYEAVAGRRLPQRPCPECERTAVVPVPSAGPLAQVGPGVARMLRTMHPMHAWPAAGPHQLNMTARGGPWPPKVAVMPTIGTLRNNFPQRPVVPPAPDRPSGKTLRGSSQPRIEGAICKRGGGKGGQRSEWACAQPGCQYVAHSSRHMVRHMTTHSGERPFACKWPGCSYRAKQREHLKTHELKHSNLKSFKCDVCSFATKRKEHLKRHLQRHASDRGAGTV